VHIGPLPSQKRQFVAVFWGDEGHGGPGKKTLPGAMSVGNWCGLEKGGMTCDTGDEAGSKESRKEEEDRGPICAPKSHEPDCLVQVHDPGGTREGKRTGKEDPEKKTKNPPRRTLNRYRGPEETHKGKGCSRGEG